jgi:prepilin-type N-terminal cleavage/methylation domain-containing protein
MRLRAGRAANDDGFTLMEVVMSVAILGIITVVLTGVVLQYLKVSASTQTRLSESTDQQFVSAYWQQDVSSLGLRSFQPSATTNPVPAESSVWKSGAGPAGVPSGCASGLPGDLVVGFAWNEYAVGVMDPDDAWSKTVNAAVYVAKAAPYDQFELIRVRCNGTTVKSHVVAQRLAEPPAVTCKNGGGADLACSSSSPVPRTVSITLTVEDKSRSTDTGYTTVLTAERRQG